MSPGTLTEAQRRLDHVRAHLEQQHRSVQQMLVDLLPHLPPEEFFTMPEAALVLGVSRNYVYVLRRDGLLPTTYDYGRTYVTARGLLDYMYTPRAPRRSHSGVETNSDEWMEVGTAQH